MKLTYVDVLGTWHTSTSCDTGSCLEVAAVADDVMIRNSTDRDGALITVSRARWNAFLSDIRSRAALAQ